MLRVKPQRAAVWQPSGRHPHRGDVRGKFANSKPQRGSDQQSSQDRLGYRSEQSSAPTGAPNAQVEPKANTAGESDQVLKNRQGSEELVEGVVTDRNGLKPGESEAFCERGDVGPDAQEPRPVSAGGVMSRRSHADGGSGVCPILGVKLSGGVNGLSPNTLMPQPDRRSGGYLG